MRGFFPILHIIAKVNVNTKYFFVGQVEGAFVQGIGFFTNEEYATNSDGLVIHDSTWTYKIPTVDTIPKQFNVELINSARVHKRVLSSKGEIIVFFL
uniref:Aldehyde oxidase/xanthine dehydrogenase second molybdopterin binding domain-containing protein n=1 Tax=Oryza rufipogon TaxID=4529 RepID=A0A0E0P2C6_ORYRU